MAIVKGKRTSEDTPVTWKSPSCTAMLTSGGVSELLGANGRMRQGGNKGDYQLNKEKVSLYTLK